MPVDTINAVPYPNVLFDLDGTLIDSGAIILASFKHATRTVLEREIPEAELAALVGGSNIYDQMRAIDDAQADELVRVYREHNEPLHDELEVFAGIEHVLAELKREGRRLGIVTAKRRKTVELAFAVLPLEPYFDVVVTSDMTERHKPDPAPVLQGARAAAGAARRGRLRRRLALRRRRREGRGRLHGRGGLGQHPPGRGARGGGRARRDPAAAPRCPLETCRSASRSCASRSSTTCTATTSSTTPRSRTPSTTASSTSCSGSRRRTRTWPRPTRRRSGWARRLPTSSARSST